MCGIAGYIRRPKGEDGHAILGQMLARITPRGPDGQGIWIHRQGDWEIGFGHRRLAIIDLEGGAQPLHTHNGEISVTFNGEIYNYLSLREDLVQKNYQFQTRSDTEVLANLYHDGGRGSVSQLNGMFAVAVWDHRDQTLTLARDRAGIKPLYYARLADGTLVFASELTALRAFPEIPADIALDSLVSYFFSDYIPPPDTILAGVKKVPAGCSVRWSNGSLEEPVPYWELKGPTGRVKVSPDQVLATELRGRLEVAVRRQLVSDVPVGIFLSGGIDSSSVAAIAQKVVGAPLKTFSIAFEDPTYDEAAFARRVANHIGSDHYEEVLSEERLLATVELALDRLDEPLGDASIVPTYLLSQLASSQVKVALGGDGGDELWGGYPTYLAHRAARVYGGIPQWIRQGIIEPLVDRLPVSDRYHSFEWKAKRFTQLWDDDPIRRHLRWMSSTDLRDLALLFPGHPIAPAVFKAMSPLASWNSPNQYLAVDFQGYLPGSVLTKVDRASMSHGLEVRPPLLDNDLVDWAFSLPASLKVRGTTTKFLLKRAVRGLIPDDIIDRPKKGFGIPVARWLRGPLRPRLEEALATSPLWELGLSKSAFLGWNEEHQASRRDLSKRLWSFLVADHWVRA